MNLSRDTEKNPDYNKLKPNTPPAQQAGSMLFVPKTLETLGRANGQIKSTGT